MKTSKIQANFARRREIEQLNVEKHAAVGKYFDKWGRTTSRYERWDSPEFYKPAEEKWKLSLEEKARLELAEKKKEESRLIYEQEKQEFYRKLNEPKRPKCKPVSTETLAGINETFKRTAEEKRRLQLESNLYKKWRIGPSEESIILNSKSNHEALAKMNWLDRQVAAQMEREKLKKDNEERQLKLQEEKRKNNEVINSRNNLRNDEISQLKSLQENHVEELKIREKESETLRIEESHLKKKKGDIEEEYAALEIHVKQREERIAPSYNLRRIKMLLRERSDAIRKDLKYDIDLLNRICDYDKGDQQQIQLVREKFEMQYDLEIQKQALIEAMYESEAKMALVKQQEVWTRESKSREKLLKGLIWDYIGQINSDIAHNEKRQKELADIRETHRQAIDSTIGRIKELLDDQKFDEVCPADNYDFGKTDNGRDENGNSYTNGKPIEETMKNVLVISEDVSVGRPRFGRKKVAWT